MPGRLQNTQKARDAVRSESALNDEPQKEKKRSLAPTLTEHAKSA
ncbi:hypothetical protein [Rhodohalobacter sp. 8-1]